MAIAEGVSLLALASKIAGRSVAAPAESRTELVAAGATIGEDAQEQDGNLLTANGDDLTAWVEEAITFFAEAGQVKAAA